jgi:sulfur relay (sulfurtransferase) complex TusBCD TusD component (DsrE family)
MADNPRTIVLIQSNPYENHQPAEALRIALGLVSGDNQVEVILMGNAVSILFDDPENLKDGETVEKFLPPLGEQLKTFYVERSALDGLPSPDSDYPTTAVSLDDIAERMTNADRFIIF